MNRGKGTLKQEQEYLSESERVGLEDNKRELESELRQEEKYGAEGIAIDTSKIKRQIAGIDSAIEARTPKRVGAGQKDKLIKEEKDLEDTIGTGMPTVFEMRQPSRNPGAVRKHMSWTDRNKENIKRYRQLQRILRPGEPKSVENLRKDR